MESELTVVKGDITPLKSLLETTLNDKVLELSEWLTRLLSIKNDDANVDRLEVVLPMVKELCWSMTIADIKKAFTMYVQNKLPIEPRDNYLTAILFSKVISAYKDQLPQPKPKVLPEPKISDEEKENLIYLGCINCFDEWVQTRSILPGYTYQYDHFVEIGNINNTKEEKKKAMARAKQVLKSKANNENEGLFRKRAIEEIESKHSSNVINCAKRILLAEYFKSLEEQELHIKDLL